MRLASRRLRRLALRRGGPENVQYHATPARTRTQNVAAVRLTANAAEPGSLFEMKARIWAYGAPSTSRSCLAVGGLGQVPASSRHTFGVHVGTARRTTQSPLPGPRQEPFLISTRSSDEDDASRGNKLNRVVRPMRAPPARRRLWWRRNSGAWD